MTREVPRGLVVLRHEIFSPWIGNLNSNSIPTYFKFKTAELYCPEPMGRQKNQRGLLRNIYFAMLEALRNRANFFFVRTCGDRDNLYSKDWAKTFSRYELNTYLFFFRFDMLCRFLFRFFRFFYKVTSIFPIFDRQLYEKIKNQNWAQVIVMPTNMPKSIEYDAIRICRRLKIKSSIIVMSLDNLTSKGCYLDIPDQVICWNDLQMELLRKKHLVAKRSIEIRPSLFFSRWLERTEALFESLRSEKTTDTTCNILYVCSSHRLGSFRQVKKSKVTAETIALNKLLRELQEGQLNRYKLQVRLHPKNALSEAILRESEISNRVTLLNANFPDSDEDIKQFANQLSSASICIGLNTSAMIQSALLGVPTFCLSGQDIDIVTVQTAHLRQLIDLGVVAPITRASEILSYDLASTGSEQREQALKFVGIR